VIKGPRVHKDFKGCLVPRVQLEKMVLLDQLDQLDSLDHVETWVFQVNMDLLDLMDYPVQEALLVKEDHLDREDSLD